MAAIEQSDMKLLRGNIGLILVGFFPGSRKETRTTTKFKVKDYMPEQR